MLHCIRHLAPPARLQYRHGASPNGEWIGADTVSLPPHRTKIQCQPSAGLSGLARQGQQAAQDGRRAAQHPPTRANVFACGIFLASKGNLSAHTPYSHSSLFTHIYRTRCVHQLNCCSVYICGDCFATRHVSVSAGSSSQHRLNRVSRAPAPWQSWLAFRLALSSSSLLSASSSPINTAGDWHPYK